MHARLSRSLCAYPAMLEAKLRSVPELRGALEDGGEPNPPPRQEEKEQEILPQTVDSCTLPSSVGEDSASPTANVSGMVFSSDHPNYTQFFKMVGR